MEYKPASITVIAVLHFVFGGLGIILGICGGVMMLAGGQNWMTPTAPGPNAANMKRMQEDIKKTMEDVPASQAVQIGNFGADLAISIAMIMSGVGLLRLRPWGRILSIVYAVASIALKIFGAIYAMAFTIPAMNQYLNTHNPTAREDQFAFSIMRAATILPPIIQVVFMIYPIVVLIIMFRPAVAAAFREGGMPNRRIHPPEQENPDYEGR
jgi:hypothetical protein